MSVDFLSFSAPVVYVEGSESPKTFWYKSLEVLTEYLQIGNARPALLYSPDRSSHESSCWAIERKGNRLRSKYHIVAKLTSYIVTFGALPLLAYIAIRFIYYKAGNVGLFGRIRLIDPKRVIEDFEKRSSKKETPLENGKIWTFEDKGGITGDITRIIISYLNKDDQKSLQLCNTRLYTLVKLDQEKCFSGLEPLKKALKALNFFCLNREAEVSSKYVIRELLLIYSLPYSSEVLSSLPEVKNAMTQIGVVPPRKNAWSVDDFEYLVSLHEWFAYALRYVIRELLEEKNKPFIDNHCVQRLFLTMHNMIIDAVEWRTWSLWQLYRLYRNYISVFKMAYPLNEDGKSIAYQLLTRVIQANCLASMSLEKSMSQNLNPPRYNFQYYVLDVPADWLGYGPADWLGVIGQDDSLEIKTHIVWPAPLREAIFNYIMFEVNQRRKLFKNFPIFVRMNPSLQTGQIPINFVFSLVQRLTSVGIYVCYPLKWVKEYKRTDDPTNHPRKINKQYECDAFTFEAFLMDPVIRQKLHDDYPNARIA